MDFLYNHDTVTFPRSARGSRPTRWGNYRISYTYSKSRNNVGEAFFSSPIDPFDLSKDWADSDDDQRHRLVLNGAVRSPAGPAHTAWERVSHGFELSAMLQYYSSRPFNITSGLTAINGTAGRPIVNGAFIERNAGIGSDFFSLNAWLSRTFRVTERLQLEGLVEGFNLTNRRNDPDAQHGLRAGGIPHEPVAHLRAD